MDNCEHVTLFVTVSKPGFLFKQNADQTRRKVDSERLNMVRITKGVIHHGLEKPILPAHRCLTIINDPLSRRTNDNDVQYPLPSTLG